MPASRGYIFTWRAKPSSSNSFLSIIAARISSAMRSNGTTSSFTDYFAVTISRLFFPLKDATTIAAASLGTFRFPTS